MASSMELVCSAKARARSVTELVLHQGPSKQIYGCIASSLADGTASPFNSASLRRCCAGMRSSGMVWPLALCLLELRSWYRSLALAAWQAGAQAPQSLSTCSGMHAVALLLGSAKESGQCTGPFGAVLALAGGTTEPRSAGTLPTQAVRAGQLCGRLGSMPPTRAAATPPHLWCPLPRAARGQWRRMRQQTPRTPSGRRQSRPRCCCQRSYTERPRPGCPPAAPPRLRRSTRPRSGPPAATHRQRSQGGHKLLRVAAPPYAARPVMRCAQPEHSQVALQHGDQGAECSRPTLSPSAYATIK